MTTAKPLARYRAIEGALASGFVTAQLHHAAGHDRQTSCASLVDVPLETEAVHPKSESTSAVDIE